MHEKNIIGIFIAKNKADKGDKFRSENIIRSACNLYSYSEEKLKHDSLERTPTRVICGKEKSLSLNQVLAGPNLES